MQLPASEILSAGCWSRPLQPALRYRVLPEIDYDLARYFVSRHGTQTSCPSSISEMRNCGLVPSRRHGFLGPLRLGEPSFAGQFSTWNLRWYFVIETYDLHELERSSEVHRKVIDMLANVKKNYRTRFCVARRLSIGRGITYPWQVTYCKLVYHDSLLNSLFGRLHTAIHGTSTCLKWIYKGKLR